MSGFAQVSAVFHCFTGTLAEGVRILDAGYLLGFTGVVTFKNAEPLRAIAHDVPLDRLLVETDAPYLAPEPLRGRTNEPANVVHTAARLAAVRGVGEAEIAAATTDNFFRLFKKVPRSAASIPSSA
jgi:TatD DNase family protein